MSHIIIFFKILLNTLHLNEEFKDRSIFELLKMCKAPVFTNVLCQVKGVERFDEYDVSQKSQI